MPKNRGVYDEKDKSTPSVGDYKVLSQAILQKDMKQLSTILQKGVELNKPLVVGAPLHKACYA